MTRFSIILPCYNAAKTILDTLESLDAQTVTAWEAICIDDGSTDDTAALIKSVAVTDPRIRLVRNPGIGPSFARNYGVELSTSDIIVFCDADDIWMSRKLADLDQVFANPTIDAVYGQVAFFEEDRPHDAEFSNVPVGNLTIEALLDENPVCTTSNIAVRRSAFRKSGGFDASLAHNEDLEWLIRLVGVGARVVGIPVLHTMYRRAPGGLSSDLDAMRSGRKRALDTAARFGVTGPESSRDGESRYTFTKPANRQSAMQATAMRSAHHLSPRRYSVVGRR